ncbi:hypothetical protein HMPREF9527_01534 [Enterococcus faecium TX0133C]|nr:hypothetical protein HMPREF9527_01534 [Enterococcus faecium TX0133C]
MTEVVSFKKLEGIYENCFSNFCEVSACFSKKLLLEHRESEVVKKLSCIK